MRDRFHNWIFVTIVVIIARAIFFNIIKIITFIGFLALSLFHSPT